jgi:hypothetical protein
MRVVWRAIGSGVRVYAAQASCSTETQHRSGERALKVTFPPLRSGGSYLAPTTVEMVGSNGPAPEVAGNPRIADITSASDELDESSGRAQRGGSVGSLQTRCFPLDIRCANRADFSG